LAQDHDVLSVQFAGDAARLALLLEIARLELRLHALESGAIVFGGA
jgi:hypothetical protein